MAHLKSWCLENDDTVRFLGLSSIVTAFDQFTIGTKVIDEDGFIDCISRIRISSKCQTENPNLIKWFLAYN